jgi:hypothetical protein
MSILLGMAALVVVLLAGAVLYDWRHRHKAPHDIDAAARRARGHAEGQGIGGQGEGIGGQGGGL